MDIPQKVTEARNAFSSGKTLDLKFRKKQLESLLKLYEDNTKAFLEALTDDLRKPKQESIVSEIDYLKNDARNLIYNLKSYAAPEAASRPLSFILDNIELRKDPYGLVLIIGAWNYPVQLILLPLAGAIAAGNCAVIKPSEMAPSCAKLIAKLIPLYLDNDCYKVITGGVTEVTKLLSLKFDYIFFTGATHVGKIIHEAAAKTLTPTTLELGGKSPVYIDDSVDMDIAAARIVWGKCLNVGQSCIAPDYVLCTKQVRDKLVEAIKKVLKEQYGHSIKKSKDFGRIITEVNVKRLAKLISGAKVVIGGDYDVSDKYFEPTVVVDVKERDPVMMEEIFGPILAIFTIGDVKEAVDFINKREKPLALYIFSNKQRDIDLLLTKTSSGNVTVNDTMMHFNCETLPFGGVGNSGMGKYHGKYSFDTFTHTKGVLIKKINKLGEILQTARYPPYSDNKLAYIRVMTRKYPNFAPQWLNCMLAFGVGVVVTIISKFIY